MKALKITSKIVGIIWMVLFSISSLFTLSKQSFDFSTAEGIGYFFGMVIFMVLLVSVGYFLYRWGAKKPGISKAV